MRVLFSIVLMSLAVLAGSAAAVLLLVRRHRMRVSDEALRRELEQIEQEQPSLPR